MGKISKYDIVYKGLKEGKHEFEYQIDEWFFELFEASMIEKGNVLVKVVFEKRNTLLTLNINLKGTVELVCDRCLDKYNQPIEQIASVYIKIGEGDSEEGDEVIWVLPEEHQINIAQLIYEYVVLSIPAKHVHPDNFNGESTCNSEMLDQIKKYSSVKKKSEPDKRWEVLNKLKNNN